MNPHVEILQELKNDIRKNLEVNMSLDCTHDSPRTRSGLQHLMAKKYSDLSKSAMYESIMNFSIKSESNCPGSGLIFLSLLVDQDSSHKNEIIRNKHDIISILNDRNFNFHIFNLLVSTLTHLTSTSKLSIKKSSNQKMYIEIVDGFSFKVKPLLKSNLELADVKVICIDGFIESVSEIHHLLTYFSEKKVAYLIFSRGMSEDVLHTIKINNDRKTMAVFPYLIPFDPENVNTIVDIAVIAGTDVVSTTKGNLISSIDLDKLGQFAFCTLSGEKLRIKNEVTKNEVKIHRSFLKKSLEERPEIEDILSARLRCLSSSCIDICIPDDINFYSMSQQLDEGIRIISSIVNNTYAPEVVARRFIDSFFDTFQNTEMFTLAPGCLL